LLENHAKSADYSIYDGVAAPLIQGLEALQQQVIGLIHKYRRDLKTSLHLFVHKDIVGMDLGNKRAVLSKIKPSLAKASLAFEYFKVQQVFYHSIFIFTLNSTLLICYAEREFWRNSRLSVTLVFDWRQDIFENGLGRAEC
jgi:hypothetical protein